MTTLEAVYAAVKDKAATIVGVTAVDKVPASPNFPTVFLAPPVITTDSLALQSATLTCDLIVLVSASDNENQSLLWRYQELSGPHSVLALFQANRNLGFTDVDVYAGEWRPLGRQEIAGYGGFGAACTLTISLG